MKITSISLKNIRGFKTLPKTELSGNINVFVGHNNSGKSTLLQSILHLQDDRSLTEFDVTAKLPGSDLVVGDITLGISDTNSSSSSSVLYNVGKVELTIPPLNEPKYYSKEENELKNFTIKETPLFSLYFSNRKVRNYNESIGENFTEESTGTLFDLIPNIDSLLEGTKRECYLRACQDVLGFLVTTKTKGSIKKAVYRYGGDDRHIDIPYMGTGVPNALGLIVELCKSSSDNIFLIEELENDLHPKALKALLDLVIKKSETNQFFISTHSNIVVRHLAGINGSKLFEVKSEKNQDPAYPMLYLSSLEEIKPNAPQERRRVLEEMGYDLFDFDLWEAWLILEESSAEMIIKHLINWRFPNLRNKLRTFAAGGIDSVPKKFNNLKTTFVFLHLTEIYRNKVWVIVDAGTGEHSSEDSVIRELKEAFVKEDGSGWEENRFSQFSKHDFERYYPEHFKADVDRVLSISDKNKKWEEKKALSKRVDNWIRADETKAKKELERTAIEVIQKLNAINEELNNP